MPAVLETNLRFCLEDVTERKLGLAPGNVPESCYLTAEERRLLAAKLASAKAAQLVVVEQTAQQHGHLFAGHDWRDVSRTSCTCRACIISRAEDMYDALGEMVTVP